MLGVFLVPQNCVEFISLIFCRADKEVFGANEHIIKTHIQNYGGTNWSSPAGCSKNVQETEPDDAAVDELPRLSGP